jgi:hypothetical protein
MADAHIRSIARPAVMPPASSDRVGVPVVMAVKTTDYLVTASTEWSRMQDLT